MDTNQPLSFMERMQLAASKRNDKLPSLTDEQKTIIRNIKTLKEHILVNYRDKMLASTTPIYTMNNSEYTSHYTVLWDSSTESDEFMQSMDVDKIMSHGYKGELPNDHRYNKNFLSILQNGLPDDHKIYISCKYVVYMFWKMDLFADRLYHYCAEHMGKCIIRAIEKNFKYASIWSMDRYASVIPELIGSDIDAILRHKMMCDGDKLTIAQRLQKLLDTDDYNKGYDPSTNNKLTVTSIYGMPRSKNPPYQIVVWGMKSI